MPDSDDLSRRRVLRSGIGALGAGALTGEAATLGGPGGLLGGGTDEGGTATGGSGEGDAANGTGSADDGIGAEEPEDVALEDLQQIPLFDLPGSVETVLPAAVPESATGIRPGSQLFVQRGGSVAGCSANFVWRDASDGTRYLGAAGHCFLGTAPAPPEFADGDVDVGVDLDDVTVSVCTDCRFGGVTGQVFRGETVELGDVVYARQSGPDGTGVGNDFGLVEIPAEAEHLIDPSMPQFGGPVGAVDGVVESGDPVVQYGAGVGNGEVYLTQARRGFSLGAGPANGSWTAALRASPGDSGSGLLAATNGLTFAGGPAAGVLTHVTPSGTAGTTVERCKELVAEDGLDVDLEVVEP